MHHICIVILASGRVPLPRHLR